MEDDKNKAKKTVDKKKNTNVAKESIKDSSNADNSESIPILKNIETNTTDTAKDTKTTIGVLEELSKSIKEQTAKNADQENDETEERKEQSKDFFTKVSGFFQSFKKSPEEKKEEKDRQSSLFSGLTSAIGGMAKAGNKMGGGIFGGIMKTIKKVFGLLKLKFLFIGALVVGMISQLNLGQLKKIWEGLKEAFTAIYEFLKPIVKYLWNWIKESVLPNLIDFFINSFKTITDTFQSIKKRFEGFGEMTLSEKVKAVFAAISDLAQGFIDLGANLVKSVLKMFGIDGDATVDKFVQPIKDYFAMFYKAFGELFTGDWRAALTTMWNGLFGAKEGELGGIVGFIWTEVIKPAAKWITDKFKFLGNMLPEFNIMDKLSTAVDDIKDWFGEKLSLVFPTFKLPSAQDMMKKFAPDKDSMFWEMPGTDSLFQAVYGKQPVDYSKLEKTQTDNRAAGKFGTKDEYMRSDEYKQLTGGKGKSPKFLKEAYAAHLDGKPMTPPKMKAGEKSIADMSTSELDQIKKDEGFRKGVYKDTMGIKTIGYGFNLERAGSQEALDAANITSSLEDLKSGKMKLTEEEASRLMMGEMGHFRSVAKRYIGEETWKNLSSNRQGILTNMAYNMGEGTLSKFQNLKAAIVKGDWKQAQVEMKDSNWSKQVKGRSDRLIARMGQNDSGQKLASAQLASSTMAKTSSAPVVITKNNSSSNSNTSYTTHPSTRDTSIDRINNATTTAHG